MSNIKDNSKQTLVPKKFQLDVRDHWRGYDSRKRLVFHRGPPVTQRYFGHCARDVHKNVPRTKQTFQLLRSIQ